MSIDPARSGGLYYRVLGPVTVLRDGAPIDLGGPQPRAVMTLLLVNANRVVSVDMLVDLLWGDSPPRNHRIQLQGLISALRKRLGTDGSRADAPIVTRSPGYLLGVSDDRIDLAAFRADLRLADQHDAARADVIAGALDRWQGPAFGGFDYPYTQGAVAAVDEERWTATERFVDVSMAQGRLDGLVERLRDLTVAHPLRESFHLRLMAALARDARADDALTVYRALRARLADELGVEPSAPIRLLYERIERAVSDRVRSAPVVAQPRRADGALVAVTAYRQMPRDPAGFVGRTAELAAVVDTGQPTTEGETAARVIVVSGMAGAGKTRLAVHAAHLLVAQGHYGDAQLFVELSGHRGSGPVPAAAALSRMLGLLGIAAPLVPQTVEARSALLRDRLTGRSVLTLLDGAIDEEQVMPLLATGSTGLVIVTSLRALAVDGAVHVTVPLFDPAESLDLLRAVIGAARVADDPAAARDLLAGCGHLPLAVAVVAHRLRTRPAWPLGRLAHRLAATGSALEELTVGGRAVEAVFEHAYRSMPAVVRRVFRRLGQHPGRDVVPLSAAALADVEPGDAESALETLLDHHLLTQVEPGRYRMHDLLRAFAERAYQRDEPDRDEDVVRHLLDFYVHAVEAAVRPLRWFPTAVPNRVAAPKTPVPPFGGIDEATTWLDAERPNVLAAVRYAGSHGYHAHAIVLPHLLRPYFLRRAPLDDWIAALRIAESAARETGHLSDLAHTLAEAGRVHGMAGRVDIEVALLREALDLHGACDDRQGRAITLSHIATAERRAGRYPQALTLYREALDLHRALGDRARTATTLSNVSVVLHFLGDDHDAVEHGRQALRLQQEADGPGEAALRTNLAEIYARLGRHTEAVTHAERALHLHETDGNQPGRASALATLCAGYAVLGRFRDAVRAGRRAVATVGGLGNPEITAWALNSLGDAYLRAGRPITAERRHRQALTTIGPDGEADERTRALAGIARSVANQP